MRKRLLLICGIAMSSVVMSVPASAQALTFTLTGDRIATFTLNSTVPNSFTTNALIGDQIFFNNVFGNFGGTNGTANISFGTNLVGALQIQSPTLPFTQLGGPNLFSGSPGNPTFNLGTFTFPAGFTNGASTLVISRAAVTGAVPEPTTWAMMLVGFGAIGFAARRRRAAVTVRAVG